MSVGCGVAFSGTESNKDVVLGGQGGFGGCYQTWISQDINVARSDSAEVSGFLYGFCQAFRRGLLPAKLALLWLS